MTTQSWRDNLSVWGPMRKQVKVHLLNLGGQNDWGSCLPAFQSLLCVNANILWKNKWQAKTYEEKTAYCCLSFGVLLACEGILSTFVSLSSTWDWAIHRDRHGLFCTKGWLYWPTSATGTVLYEESNQQRNTSGLSCIPGASPDLTLTCWT